MNLENVKSYQLIEHHHSEDLKSEAYLLEHKKSGARITVLENDDENKVFYIGFRTPPKDSTGVAHILEHSVLCGSEKYPLKDPFVELVKGSLNTFLNAMTYPDKTVYPVASCNDQDFKNLMSVYMDAVLHPNIYKEKKIFLQEGWHYELEDKDADLKINGVVYNEMKGAFSAPDDVLARETFNSLFSDTAYGVESGGDPDVIPELTYEEFLAFHGRYYHPSNSYIFLYGNADMEERLNWLDQTYLSEYDRIEVDSFPGVQEAFAARKRMYRQYPITEDEKEENNTYLTYNSVVSNVLDRKLYLAFQMVDYALIAADGTPLWKALMEAGIGTEIYSTFENGIYQPFYSIVAKNANKEDEEEFVRIIEEVCRKVVKEGFDKNALLACLNSLEFRFREGDTGTYPKGLLYGLKALDSWLYDKDAPFIHLEELDTFAELRKEIDTGYFEDLVQKYILDNNHKSILILSPKKGLTSQKDKALADKLAAQKASLSDAEQEQLVRATAELKEYQGTPDPKEAYECLPTLKLSDIKKEAEPLTYEETEVDGIFTLFHEIETNGILYFNMLFDLKDVPVRLYPYLGLLQGVLRCVDTEHYSYEQLGYEIDKQLGNLSASVLTAVPGRKVENYTQYFNIAMSALQSQAVKGLELIREILHTSKITDTKRLREIVMEGRSRMQGFMMSAGHTVAASHALSYTSEFDQAKEVITGMQFYYFLADLEEHYDEKKDEVAARLEEVAEWIFRKDRLMLDVIGTRAELDALRGHIAPILEGFSDEPLKEERGSLAFSQKNEAFTNSAQVQYVCRAGNYVKHGLEYNGALNVLKTILGYQYLWTEVRVKGGAYGCMSSFQPYGDAYFVSYRDPNLENTLDIFAKAADYIRSFEADEKEMTKYIIGTMSNLDIPLTPRIRGIRSRTAYLEGTTYEMLQKAREEVLNAKAEDIRALAAYIDAFMSDENVCVVGNEDKIKAAKEQFAEVKPLFS